MRSLKAPTRCVTLNEAAEILAGEPQWVRDSTTPGGKMSDNFMKAYTFLLSALASGELKGRGPDNPDAEEVIVDRELCWDWVIEAHHLSAFLDRRHAGTPGFDGDRVQFESARDPLTAAPHSPRRS